MCEEVHKTRSNVAAERKIDQIYASVINLPDEEKLSHHAVFKGGILAQESDETRKRSFSKLHRVGCQRTNLGLQTELMIFSKNSISC
jgi:hypothetical protein